MYTRLPGFALGFHGCEKNLAQRVVTGKLRLNASKNDYDWLGHGVYFWENSPERAWSFACEQKHRGKIEKPAVIGAVLDLGLCMNLQDIKYHHMLRKAYDAYEQMWPGKELIPNKGGRALLLRFRDCFVFQLFHRLVAETGALPFDSVRCAFEEGDPSFLGSGLRDKTHIQICIRNPYCIKGYFLPLQPDGRAMIFSES